MKRRKMLKQIGRGGNEEVLCYREGLLFTHNVPGRGSLLDVIIGNIAKNMNYSLNNKKQDSFLWGNKTGIMKQNLYLIDLKLN